MLRDKEDLGEVLKLGKAVSVFVFTVIAQLDAKV